MDFDWKAAVKTVAPWLGTAIGTAVGGPAGPLVGMATKTLCNVLLGKDEAEESELSAAVQGATREQWMEIKRQDQEFKKHAKEMGIKKLSILAGDKASARQMAIATKSKTPDRLIYLETALVFIMIMGLMFIPIPEINKAIVNMTFGSVMTVWINGTQFFHGATIKEDD